MDPICFTIGTRPVYWYGVMVAIGFLVAVAHWDALARRAGRPAGYGSELGFWIMLSGIVGARVAFVIANFGEFAENPLDILRIDRGGLIYYGGFIGAVIAVYVFARMHHEKALWLGDFSASALPLGHAIGRIGCFMNGCCYGTACHLPWAVYLEGTTRHPTQLYEAGLNLILYGLLVRIYLRKKRNGIVLASYLLLYPPGRFLVEFLRGDTRLHWHGLNAAQEVSVLLFLAGVILWICVRRRPADDTPAATATG